MASTDDVMTLTFNGNVYLEHPVSVYRDEGFLKLVELQRNTDVAFANLECSILDGQGEEWPAFGSGMGYAGSYLGAPPMMVDELKFLGVNALYAANNHSCDFGEIGILTTIKHLRAAGIDFAGIGASYTEAGDPCFISTAHGRVALISVADWGPRQNMDLPSPWPHGYLGSDEGPWYRSRPGVDLFRYDAAIHVDQASFAELHRISEAMGWETIKAARSLGGGTSTQPRSAPANMSWEQDSDDVFYFMGRKFVVDDDFGFTTFPYDEDAEHLYKRIREARRSADVVVVALHDQIHGEIIHDYIRAVSRGSIDAGADIFACTAGEAKGVEIYKGKPIIHGLYSYCFQNSQVRHVPRSLLQNRGLAPDSVAADFYASREETGLKAETETGIKRHPSWTRVGNVVYAAVLDADLKIIEVRSYPTINLGGSRHRLPTLLEAGTSVFNQVLDRERGYCSDLGSPFEVRDSYGVIPIAGQ